MNPHPTPNPEDTVAGDLPTVPAVVMSLARIALASVARCGLKVEDSVRIQHFSDPFDGVAVSVWDGPANNHRYFYAVVKQAARDHVPHLLVCVGRNPSSGGRVDTDGTPQPLDEQSRRLAELACRGHLRLVRDSGTNSMQRMQHTPAFEFIPVVDPGDDPDEPEWAGNGAEIDGFIMLNLFTYLSDGDFLETIAGRTHGEVMDVFRTAVSVAESVVAGCGRYSLHRDAALLHWGTDTRLQFYAGLMYRAIARGASGYSPVTVLYDGQAPNHTALGCPAQPLVPDTSGANNKHVWSGKLQLAYPRPMLVW